MNELGVAIRPVKNCFQSQYTLPTFQREYKWEAKHFSELVNDIQDAFLEQYEPSHGRKSVAGYRSYFLGSIITSIEFGGKKPIIDGQQRLTSLFVLMAYLKRYCNENSVSDVQDLLALMQRTSYGAVDYSIEFSEGRRRVFAEYLDLSVSENDVMQRIEGLPDLDESDRKVVHALKNVGGDLDDVVKSSIAFFIDYLVEKVTMIEISVANENDAHRVFVTMNDRGLRLGPIDLLKGHVLSKIDDARENHACHEQWMKTVTSLKTIDPEEDSLFFRAMLRARWANTVRDKKKKGEPPGDFEVIGDAYHRWFAEHAPTLAYNTADDFARFARDEVPKYADVYEFIRKAEEHLTPAFEHIYYNAARKYTLQPMVLLATVLPTDTSQDWRSKVRYMAQLWDLILTTRSIEGKENNYDNLKELSFDLMKRMRGKTVPDLLALVRQEWDSHHAAIKNVAAMLYAKSDRTDILYVLARIGTYLEEQLNLTNRVGFETYWSRDRGAKTFDVEHILRAASADWQKLGFASSIEYSQERNRLGALVVLPRSRNRSLQDKSYAEKLPAYATENVLAQSLSSGWYANNPAVAALVATHPELQAVQDFNKSSLGQRSALYTRLAEQLWSKP